MKRTKIVCTIGPASESVEILVKMIEAGMSVARLNFSHGNYEEHLMRIQNIRKAEAQTGKPIGIMLDTKGPEIRTHDMEDGRLFLEKETEVRVAMKETLGTAQKISVSYAQLIEDIHVGSTILLDDGLITLRVTGIDQVSNEIITEVENDGELTNKKGVNVPGVQVNLPGLTDKDIADIHFGLENGIDFIAPSFIRRAKNVLEIVEILEEEDKMNVQIIPKIENREGVENLDEILRFSDGLMVARGDLGVEMPVEDVPIIQKDMISKCNAAGKPVITATHMLDSMVHNPRPTRAEANDVANAIFDGSDSIMLSGESAAGLYPVESVEMMYKIAIRTEEALLNQDAFTMDAFDPTDMTEAIGQAVGHTAKNLKIKTIVAATESGHTARMISKFRPKATIVAVTFSKETLRTLTLQWGVEPVLAKKPASTDDMFNLASLLAIEKGFSKEGDPILITAGVPVGERGTTNVMKIQLLGSKLVTGQGIGNSSVVGKAIVAYTADEANEHTKDNSILVVQTTNKDYLPAIQRASALVVEQGGLTSHAAVIGIAMGIPVIVNAEHATEHITNDELITIDERRGIVYKGAAAAI